MNAHLQIAMHARKAITMQETIYARSKRNTAILGRIQKMKSAWVVPLDMKCMRENAMPHNAYIQTITQ